MTTREMREPAPAPVLTRLADWYAARCDGEWEHSFGVRIATLDNPGWSVKIDLSESMCAAIGTKEFSLDNGPDDWMRCFVKEAQFHGVGDPLKLEPIIIYFLDQIACSGGCPA